MSSVEKDCVVCRHYRRTQIGPHYWEVECFARSADFDDADQCASYEPPRSPGVCRESSGLGYVWDDEWEGQP